jgi:glycerol-3-phosphate dehydrogenase (NAD(P)+)
MASDDIKLAAVLGGGAYGTALAQVLGRKGIKVTMWARDFVVVNSINTDHENKKLLPGIILHENISATNDFVQAVTGAELVLIAIPTQFLRSVIAAHRTELPVGAPLVSLAKGIEIGTLLSPYEILVEELPGKYHGYIAVLSGPSFAAETARGQPTSVLLACPNKDLGAKIQGMISDAFFRAYTGTDMVGAELGGAVKNVLAIACGASHGFGFQQNTSAHLISRGLMEMTRLVIKKGGSEKTMMGLAGVGDLVLTCSSHQSRNFTVGMRIAKGETLEQILASTHSVAEGVKSAESIHMLAEKCGIEMPICEAVYQVLYCNKSFKDALVDLQSRPLTVEFY